MKARLIWLCLCAAASACAIWGPAPPPSGPGPQFLVPAQSGSKPWIFILCKFSGNDSEPGTIAKYESLIGSEYPGLDHYWREVSQDRINLAGSKVIGWYTLPRTQPEYLVNGRFDIGRAFNDAVSVTDKDVYFPSFSGIALIFNDYLAPPEPANYQKTMGYGGPLLTKLDGVTRQWGVTWLPADHRHSVFGHDTVTLHHTQAHEMGHALGLPHSSGAYGDTYDSFWDLMSYWGGSYTDHPEFGIVAIHPTAFHKDLLGWLSSEQKTTVQPGEQKTIQLIGGSANAAGVKLIEVRIPGSSSLYCTIEARKRIGYDAGLISEAVIIHDIDPSRYEVNKNGFGTEWRPSHVVDVDQNGYTGDEGAIWHPGEVFADVQRGIYVLIGPETENGYQVTISNNVQGYSDFVSGAGITSTLMLINPAANRTSSGTATMSTTDGQPLSGRINGSGKVGEFGISVSPNGVALFSTDPSEPTKQGSLAVGSDSLLAGSMLFEGPFGSAAVPGQSYPTSSAILPVLPAASNGSRTGVAISNPGSNSLSLTLRLRDSEGMLIPGGEKSLKLVPKGQIAAFVDELVPGGISQSAQTLEITSDAPFHTLSLLPGNGYFATLPVSSVNTGAGAGRTGTVKTFAGRAGIPGSEDGPRETATFNSPRDLAIAPDGTMYVSDAANQVIRKISPDGMVSTFAGQKGVAGGKDGKALEAQFSWPHGLCLDPAGNLFVADSSNHAIRKISPEGNVTTLAGQLGVQGSADGTSSEARFKRPRGIAVDSAGDLYVSDQGNQTIRKISAGGAVTTIAGQVGQSGYADGPGKEALFRTPWFLDVDKQGVVYVADLDNCVIRAISKNGVVRTVAGNAGKHGFYDAVPDQALFGWPIGIAADTGGRILMTDHYVLRQVEPGKRVQTLAGYSQIYSTPNSPPEGTDDGVGIAARFNFLFGLAISPSGDVYAVDMNSHTIRKIEIRENLFTTQLPHYADGNGVASTLVLMNPSRTEKATVKTTVFGDEGQASPNGMDLVIPPEGIRVLSTPGPGEMVTGSLAVDSNIPLAGALLYSTPFGVAGVPASTSGKRLMIAIEEDVGIGLRTGAAVANPGDQQVNVTLILRNQQGTVVAQTSLDLPGHGHCAKFCDELFQIQDRFAGSIEIVAPAPVCAVGLRVTASELATLPVWVEP